MEKKRDIEKEFIPVFERFKQSHNLINLSYVVTSRDREGNPKTNPHTLPGNALDFTLREKGDYAGIKRYNQLFAFLFSYWPYRAGIDNTEKNGNVHIHIDLGQVRPSGQTLPYFFKEDNGKWLYEITSKKQI